MDLDFLAINFFGEYVDSEPTGNDNFAAFGYGVSYPFAKSVPGINVDPESGFLFVGELFDSDGELHDLVSCVSKGDDAGCLSNISDYR